MCVCVCAPLERGEGKRAIGEAGLAGRAWVSRWTGQYSRYNGANEPMGFGSTAGGGGFLAMVFTACSMLRSEEPPEPKIERVTEGSNVFEPWELDRFSVWDTENAPEPECAWTNGSLVFESDYCSHFTLSRLASIASAQAIDRASKCASKFESECVLSPEIGLSFPAAFVYSGDGVSMDMIIAPRIVEASDAKRIKVETPGGSALPRTMELNNSIRAEYLPGGSRTPVLRDFSGADAFCIQLLRAAFVLDCWESLE